MKYVYHISYGINGGGFGRCEAFLDAEITTGTALMEAESELSKINEGKAIVILCFTLLRIEVIG